MKKDQMEGKVLTRNTDEYCKYRFNEDEIKDLGGQMAQSYQRLQTLEAEKKSVATRFKNDIEAEQLKASNIADNISTGWEMRQLPCIEEWDYETGIITTTRNDTGEIVRTRQMLEADRQAKLFDKEA